MNSTEIQILRNISQNPRISQREIASKNEISLGKVNYVIRSLVDKGHVKVRNFRKSKNKKRYMYLLTPKGMTEKARLTAEFLRREMEEYEKLQKELRELKQELHEYKKSNDRD